MTAGITIPLFLLASMLDSVLKWIDISVVKFFNDFYGTFHL